MSNVVRACFALSLVVAACGCARQEELVMVDPRTGVKVVCRLDEPVTSSRSAVGAVRQAYTCIDELQYYGFRDEDLVNPPAN